MSCSAEMTPSTSAARESWMEMPSSGLVPTRVVVTPRRSGWSGRSGRVSARSRAQCRTPAVIARATLAAVTSPAGPRPRTSASRRGRVRGRHEVGVAVHLGVGTDQQPIHQPAVEQPVECTLGSAQRHALDVADGQGPASLLQRGVDDALPSAARDRWSGELSGWPACAEWSDPMTPRCADGWACRLRPGGLVDVGPSRCAVPPRSSSASGSPASTARPRCAGRAASR